MSFPGNLFAGELDSSSGMRLGATDRGGAGIPLSSSHSGNIGGSGGAGRTISESRGRLGRDGGFGGGGCPGWSSSSAQPSSDPLSVSESLPSGSAGGIGGTIGAFSPSWCSSPSLSGCGGNASWPSLLPSSSELSEWVGSGTPRSIFTDAFRFTNAASPRCFRPPPSVQGTSSDSLARPQARRSPPRRRPPASAWAV